MKKAYEKVEKGITNAILQGETPPGSSLQSERELAARFDVSRLVVREALQKLAQAAWISISQRRVAQVNDFWSTGTLDILSTIARNTDSFPMELAAQLLEMRAEIAPDYARRAVRNDSPQLIAQLARARKLGDSPAAFARFDWELHRTMAILSGNRIYPLLLNTFAKLYFKMRGSFFTTEDYREASRDYYRKLLRAAIDENAEEADKITHSAMWQRVHLFRRQMEEKGKC